MVSDGKIIAKTPAKTALKMLRLKAQDQVQTPKAVDEVVQQSCERWDDGF